MTKVRYRSLMEILEEKGLSKAAFARELGKSDQTGYKWSKGLQCPEIPPWAFMDFVRKFDFDPDELAEAMRRAYESGRRAIAAEPAEKYQSKRREKLEKPNDR